MILQVYLGSSLGNVSLYPVGPEKYILQSASAWLLLYHLRFQPDNVSIISGLWEHVSVNAFTKALFKRVLFAQKFAEMMLAYKNPYLEVTIFHSQTLTEELARNADSLVPKFVMSFTILIAFSTLNGIAFVKSTFYVDWVTSRPMLSLMGCINAGMGIVSSLGLLFFAETEFNQIVNVMPFLVLGTFLLCHLHFPHASFPGHIVKTFLRFGLTAFNKHSLHFHFSFELMHVFSKHNERESVCGCEQRALRGCKVTDFLSIIPAFYSDRRRQHVPDECGVRAHRSLVDSASTCR